MAIDDFPEMRATAMSGLPGVYFEFVAPPYPDGNFLANMGYRPTPFEQLTRRCEYCGRRNQYLSSMCEGCGAPL